MLFSKKTNIYYLKYCYLFIIGVLTLIVIDYVQLDIAEILGKLIDSIDKNTLTNELLFAFMRQLVKIIIIVFTGRILWRLAIFGLGVLVESDLRLRMFKKLSTLSESFFNEHKVGAIMALFTNDLITIKNCFGQGTLLLVDGLFLGAMTFYKMVKLNVALSIASIIPIVLLLIVGSFVGKYMSKKSESRQKAFEGLSDFTQENFSGLYVVKAFVKEFNELVRFQKVNKNNEEKTLEYISLSIKLQVLLSAILNLVLLIIIGYGGYIIHKTNFTVGDLTTFTAYFNTLIWPMMALAQLIDLRSQGNASLRRVNIIFDTEVEVKDKINAIDICGFNQSIVFNHLSFSYGDDIKILDDISFMIKKGEKIGIVGKTGSGKGTIINLLLRLYNVGNNEILIDGKCVNDIKISSIRQLISYVPQDNFLFATSVKDNIGFAIDGDISLEDAINSAKIANVHENILEFTNSYDTILGERGVTVSGGQKQRISIARALLKADLKNSDIIIFDDALSAVDTDTENVILQNLREKYFDKTIIIIAHRILTVQNLDKILLLDEGKVIGFDTHDNLYKNNQIYHDMVELQKLEQEEHKDE